ncbi:MAG: hypothetical protein R6U25_06440, partial [Alkalispirochaeta sp.]
PWGLAAIPGAWPLSLGPGRYPWGLAAIPGAWPLSLGPGRYPPPAIPRIADPLFDHAGALR